MSDIIERLRHASTSYGSSQLALDALAEIERLGRMTAEEFGRAELLRTALARAREDLYYLAESERLLAPAVERIDAAIKASR